jgi:hypothetical protein
MNDPTKTVEEKMKEYGFTKEVHLSNKLYATPEEIKKIEE